MFWLYHSFLTLSLAFWTTLRIQMIPLYSHLGQKLHLMCFDSMLVIINSFSIYQLLSENRKRQKSPDIFINSLPRSRNFHISQSLAVRRGFRITWGAYLITTKQCPESFLLRIFMVSIFSSHILISDYQLSYHWKMISLLSKLILFRLLVLFSAPEDALCFFRC